MHVLFFPKYTHHLYVFNNYFVGIAQGLTFFIKSYGPSGVTTA